MTMICRFTRLVECIPIKDVTAQSYANSFLLRWLARFGVPETVTVDRARQWTPICERTYVNFWGLSYVLPQQTNPPQAV